MDGSLVCKHGSQGGQAGWAVAQIHETSHELVCSAHGAMPISLPVQRRILRAELWALWQATTLSDPGATFVSDSATVLRGLERGPKWCTAARGPHVDVWRRIWECVRDVGDEAHIDSVSKCKALLSKSEQAKLDEADRLTTAGNAWTDELAKEGARDDSFQSILYDTYKAAVETSKAIIGNIGPMQGPHLFIAVQLHHCPTTCSPLASIPQQGGVSSNMTLEALCWRAPAFVLLRVPLFHTEVTPAPLTFTERVRDDLSLFVTSTPFFEVLALCSHFLRASGISRLTSYHSGPWRSLCVSVPSSL